MVKKKLIKVKFLDIPGKDLFLDLLKKDYKVIETDKPDYVFFTLIPSQKQKGNLRNISHRIPFLKKYASNIYQAMSDFPIFGRFLFKVFYDELKMPVVKTNAKRIFYTAENCRPNMKNCEWAFTFDYDEDLKHPRHLRLTYYKVEGAGKDLIKKNIDFEKIKNQKTKFCSFIYSKNAPFRNNFFKKLSKYKRIDAPGYSMNNMPSFLTKKTEKRFIPNASMGDWQRQKIKFLNQYKFTIAFENSSYPGYTTEKIYHPMLANSIPIYWGNRLVHKDFNTKSFLNYHYFEKLELQKIPKIFLKIPLLSKIIKRFIIESRTIKALVKRIIEIDQNDWLYSQYLKEPWYKDNKPSKYVDDNLIRKKLKQIFG